MTFALPPTIALALGCACLPVFILWAAARLMGTTDSPGRRFVIAEAIGFGTWALCMALGFDTFDPAWQDVLAALLILMGGALAAFTLWSLLAWGFTSSMLLTLSRADRPLNLDEWVVRYTRGGDCAVFTRNRLGVLLRFGLARETPDGVVPMPGRAVMVGASALCLRSLFGLRT